MRKLRSGFHYPNNDTQQQLWQGPNDHNNSSLRCFQAVVLPQPLQFLYNPICHINWKHHMFCLRFCLAATTIILLSYPSEKALAWGAKGHTAIGILSMRLIDEKAQQELERILGSIDNEQMKASCNWPDNMRELPEWEWATPQHYINIPRSESEYDRERDCPDGICAPEAVKKYAGELADDRLPQQQRKEAFAWLCHVVGDMHQPLHCGFGDDHGGNDVTVMVDDVEMVLHQFWDRHLINTNSGSVCKLLEQMSPLLEAEDNNHWNPIEADQWTNESRALAATISYPEEAQISAQFEQQSWQVVEQQIPLAAKRLARILNATLGDGEVILDR
jgi:hypothetical protein